ncbi:DUF3885 domain-containing protein [Brevibacillus formosus]|uniref:DUF3885 domain-containing protein n=1 Tax=Brevibacillus TaxID=55080 RepID=UPI000D11373F|nr:MULTISPECIES: DUF3885 domain-containing protein [Brevibacillus]MBG9945379.1 hypothetical protein [Brevibacillus formosus]MED1943748.1 DUF3885 domain-containing protein [Brevibacillus formosus]MED1999880.1 DUF3885 domain-containing protein [Brevibacillus formosus]MED2081983.1 DUF3885 domain-containing protein [Brevibacillus formosus]PSK19079.1 hypothetical protein C7R94_09885 [Brevibacillus sp. NRRL NRS-603]
MTLQEYLHHTFPTLMLRPPLFYSWDIGIRFELGVDYNYHNVYENGPYLQGVYTRAITLCKTLHAPTDDIYIVVDVNDFGDGRAFKRKLNVFSKYVKNKSLLYNLQQHTIPYVFPEDDENEAYLTHRFVLKCKTSDFAFVPMIKAICRQDMGLQPRICHRVYFINTSKQTIFHIYDDRGCDLLATSPETIRGIYESYSHWILDYDRAKIDQVFS